MLYVKDVKTTFNKFNKQMLYVKSVKTYRTKGRKV